MKIVYSDLIVNGTHMIRIGQVIHSIWSHHVLSYIIQLGTVYKGPIKSENKNLSVNLCLFLHAMPYNLKK